MTDQKINAFISYTHFDNTHDDDFVGWLGRRLAGEVRIQSGVQFQIFIDSDYLEPGMQWSTELENMLNSSLILFPIITPSYFNSEYCEIEYNLFREREQLLGRSDLIIPIYYITCDQIEHVDNTSNVWLEDIKARQYMDWRHLRHQSRISSLMLQEVASLASIIKKRISQEIGNNNNTQNKYEDRHMHKIPSSNSPRFGEYIERTFFGMSKTQRLILTVLYNHHKSEIAADDLFLLVKDKHGEDLIDSEVEIFYRLRDLMHLGFLEMKPVGARTTLAITLPDVGNILYDRKLIIT